MKDEWARRREARLAREAAEAEKAAAAAAAEERANEAALLAMIDRISKPGRDGAMGPMGLPGPPGPKGDPGRTRTCVRVEFEYGRGTLVTPDGNSVNAEIIVGATSHFSDGSTQRDRIIRNPYGRPLEIVTDGRAD